MAYQLVKPLWKATRNIKQPQRLMLLLKENKNNSKWLKEKANVFADHLVNVLKPYSIAGNEEHANGILESLDAPLHMDLLVRSFKTKEVKRVEEINRRKCQKMITTIYNAVLRLGYYPRQ